MDRPYVDVADTATRGRNLLHVVLLLVATVLAANLLVGAGIAALAALGISLEGNEVLVYSIRFSLNYVAFVLVALWYLDWFDGWDLFELRVPTQRGLAAIGGGLAVLLVANHLYGLALAYFDVRQARNVTLEVAEEFPELLLALIVISVLLNAPSEELVYRGLVQGLVRDAYGVVPGVVIAAGLFGAVHWFALGADGSRLVYVAMAVVLGAILGALYELTRNLAVPIVVHGLYNAALYGYVYATQTGLIRGL